LAGDGIDPASKPKVKPLATLDDLFALVGMVVAVLLLMLAVSWIKSWLKK